MPRGRAENEALNAGFSSGDSRRSGIRRGNGGICGIPAIFPPVAGGLQRPTSMNRLKSVVSDRRAPMNRQRRSACVDAHEVPRSLGQIAPAWPTSRTIDHARDTDSANPRSYLQGSLRCSSLLMLCLDFIGSSPEKRVFMDFKFADGSPLCTAKWQLLQMHINSSTLVR